MLVLIASSYPHMECRGLESLDQESILSAIARAPYDQYVVWDGTAARAHPHSLASCALSCVDEVWIPVPLRVLMLRASGAGLDPEKARKAVQQHQKAQPATHLLVRRTAAGEFVVVTDIPWPANQSGPLRSGDLLLDRHDRRSGFGSVKTSSGA